MLCVAMRRIEKNAEGYKIVLANGQQRPKSRNMQGISEEWWQRQGSQEKTLPGIRPLTALHHDEPAASDCDNLS